jgi:hypothetical protein
MRADFPSQDLESEIQRLEKQPAGAAETIAAANKLHRRLWQAVAHGRPQGISTQLAASLIGLRYEFASNSSVMSALARGKGGKAEVLVRARTQPWSPAVELALEVAPPPGWQVAAGAKPVAASPGVLVNLTAGVQVPQQADLRQLPVKIKVVLEGTPLVVEDHFDVSQREILNWLVLGPLPNHGGTQPDAVVHVAETRLDAGATYEGLTGKIAWQPATLGNRYLHFDQRWKPERPATALAVACLRVECPMAVALQLHSRGAAEFSLGGTSIAKIDPPNGDKTVRVELHPGDNLLVCKSSFLTGMWEIAVDVKPLQAGPPITQVPAAELPALEALRPGIHNKASKSRHARTVNGRLPGEGQVSLCTMAAAAGESWASVPPGAAALGYTKCVINETPTAADVAPGRSGHYKWFSGQWFSKTTPSLDHYETQSGVLALKLGGELVSAPLDFSPGRLPLLAGAEGFYVEFDVRLSDNDRDHWPAVWLMPAEHDGKHDHYQGDPAGFERFMELDVDEGGFGPGLTGTVHSTEGVYPRWKHVQNPNNVSRTPLDRSQMHTFGASYDPAQQKATWWVDGKQQMSAGAPFVPAVAARQHFYLILSGQSHGANKPHFTLISGVRAYVPQ